jgi:hypothetical protein
MSEKEPWKNRTSLGRQRIIAINPEIQKNMLTHFQYKYWNLLHNANKTKKSSMFL